MMIAEESTAWPKVTHPVEHGGLGFTHKWNMGWMHDTLGYFQTDAVHRRWHHRELTFSLVYAFNENFMLPLSHDEVVYGKGSLIGKMPGDPWRQFANLRLLFGHMWAHPGKKLLFMGGEFGQRREWTHDGELEWWVTEQTGHGGLQRLVAQLNRVYREAPALHQLDFSAAGFEWITADDEEKSVFAFLRKSADGSPPLLVVCNMTPVPRTNYVLGVPGGIDGAMGGGFWREVVNTDAAEFGGAGWGNLGGVEAAPVRSHGRMHSVSLTLPPLSTLILEQRTTP
jgi:1,4-alpha-glucan branching enzyme